MYAIVDIETTGGHASANGITEIAICIHNGTTVVERYNTLINPGRDIPIYIQALTGISNEMVQNAPSFKQVSHEIYQMLNGHIFVAHNVNFDYSFLRYHLAAAGYELQANKLCTVRLTRKIIPGLPSYSLGRLCRHLGIDNESRHRAAGDAEPDRLPEATRLRDRETQDAPHLRPFAGVRRPVTGHRRPLVSRHGTPPPPA